MNAGCRTLQQAGIIKKISILAFLFITIPPVIAQGIGVAPHKIEIEAVNGKTVKKQLIVFNPSDEHLDFEIRAGRWFGFSPRNFSLSPYEKQNVLATITPEKTGSFEETISIMLKQKSNKGLAINLGAAVRVKITSKPKTSTVIGAATTASIIALGLSVFYVFSRPKP